MLYTLGIPIGYHLYTLGIYVEEHTIYLGYTYWVPSIYLGYMLKNMLYTLGIPVGLHLYTLGIHVEEHDIPWVYLLGNIYISWVYIIIVPSFFVVVSYPTRKKKERKEKKRKEKEKCNDKISLCQKIICFFFLSKFKMLLL